MSGSCPLHARNVPAWRISGTNTREISPATQKPCRTERLTPLISRAPRAWATNAATAEIAPIPNSSSGWTIDTVSAPAARDFGPSHPIITTSVVLIDIWASWAAIRWVCGRAATLALVCGVLTGAATLMHATGHLLVPVVAAAVAWRRRGWLWSILTIVAFGLVHAVTWAGLFLGIRATGNLPESVGVTDPGNPADYLLAPGQIHVHQGHCRSLPGEPLGDCST